MSAHQIPLPERRSDTDQKLARLLDVLSVQNLQGVLIFEPANFAWLTSGAESRGVLDNEQAPILCVTQEYRHVLCYCADVQRLFDEEMDALGFLIKDWTCKSDRDLILQALRRKWQLGSDRLFEPCVCVRELFTELRRRLSPWDLLQLQRLGVMVANALETTARSVNVGDTEAEIAGQLAYRLLRRGLEPVALHVTADGRAAKYPRATASLAPVRRYAVLDVTARFHGLHVTASRTVAFCELNEKEKAAFDAVCLLSAAWQASTRPGQSVSTITNPTRSLWSRGGDEFGYLCNSPGFRTGFEPHAGALEPSTILEPTEAVTWRAQVAGMLSCDTMVVGGGNVTPLENWPIRRVRVNGITVDRPDVLVRLPR